jgi:hypothetical protein
MPKEVAVKNPPKRKQIIDRGIITKIQATSRCSVKLKETFYTFEFVQELTFDPTKKYNFEIEKEELWETVHAEVDKQVREVMELM